MWMLVNHTPFAVERGWQRDADGVPHWLVAVRATYDLDVDDDEGRLGVAEAQQPVLLTTDFFGAPGASSVRYEADVGLPKPTTDVVLLAAAHAPDGRSATQVVVGLRFGGLHKQLLVHGDRTYDDDGSLTPARAFEHKLIRYEQALGGSDDPRNPVGCGFAGDPRALPGTAAPCVSHLADAARGAEPAGFGPLASDWLPRRAYAGTYDERWYEGKRPLLPDDYDPRFTLCAPADQQPSAYLAGGSQLELANLTPHGLLRLTLPSVGLTFRTHFGSRVVTHAGQLASVIVEPEERRLALVWQSALRVRACEVEHLDRTVVDMGVSA